jgi:hypothetical protein
MASYAACMMIFEEGNLLTAKNDITHAEEELRSFFPYRFFVKHIWGVLRHFAQSFVNRELKYIPEVVGVEERICALARVYYINYNCLMVITDRRILFLKDQTNSGPKVWQHLLSDISYIETKVGLFLGYIRLFLKKNNNDDGEQYFKEVEQIDKRDIMNLSHSISQLIRKE